MTDRDFIPGTDEWHEARGTTKPKPPTPSPMTQDKPKIKLSPCYEGSDP